MRPRGVLILLVGCGQPAPSLPSLPTVSAIPPGPLAPPAGTVRLFGTEWLDVAGLELKVGDADGDGLADVVVAASSLAVYGYGQTTSSSAYLLRSPVSEGPLDEVATAVFPARYVDDYEGSSSVILTSEHLIALSNDGDGSVLARAFAGDASGTLAYDAAVAEVEAEGYKDRGRFGLEDCHGTALGAGGLCWGSNSWQEDRHDFSGAIVVLPPVRDGATWDDALVTVHGEPGDGVSVVDGAHDLDGDGLNDLAIGAYAPFRDDDTGWVSVVTGGPTGIVALADATVASFRGEIPGAELGLRVHAADLDGDGSADVFGGAAVTDVQPCVYGMATPWAGEVAGADTDWRFCGERWLGYDFAVGDFDDDGAMDLAAGAPDAIYRGEVPGVVVVWAAPAPGGHDLTDADALFGSGSATADAFGYRMGAGDIDGDGRDDLAIGAPLDDELAESAGMVAIVPGGGL